MIEERSFSALKTGMIMIDRERASAELASAD